MHTKTINLEIEGEQFKCVVDFEFTPGEAFQAAVPLFYKKKRRHFCEGDFLYTESPCT